jgi:hypothetical protein
MPISKRVIALLGLLIVVGCGADSGDVRQTARCPSPTELGQGDDVAAASGEAIVDEGAEVEKAGDVLSGDDLSDCQRRSDDAVGRSLPGSDHQDGWDSHGD